MRYTLRSAGFHIAGKGLRLAVPAVLFAVLLGIMTVSPCSAGTSIKGRIYGLVYNLADEPVADARVTVLQVYDTYSEDAIGDGNTEYTDETGFYSTSGKLGAFSSKSTLSSYQQKFEMNHGQMLVHVEAQGYKPFTGIVDAFAQDTGGASKISLAYYALFLHTVYLAPEDSDEESQSINAPYFLFYDAVVMENASFDKDYVITVRTTVPKIGKLKDYHPQVVLMHMDKGGQFSLKSGCEFRDDGAAPDETAEDGIWSCKARWTRKLTLPGRNVFKFDFATAKDFKIIYDASNPNTVMYQTSNNMGLSDQRYSDDENSQRKFINYIAINIGD